MRRKAHQVHAQGLHVDVQQASRLNGVRVDRNRPITPLSLLFDAPRDLGNGLDGPGLVVGQHHADQDGLVGYGPADGVGIYEAVAVDRQVGDIESKLL